MNDKVFESLFVYIFLNTGTQKKDKFTIGIIYRSPNQNTDTNAQFIDSLIYPIVRTISKANTPARITGDFNNNLLKYQNQHTSNFCDVMYEHSFFPTITKPIRITSSATVLDHIWTNVFNSKMSSSILTDCVADHLPVTLYLETKNDILTLKKS